MPRFTFTLEGVLRHRQNVEAQRHTALAEALAAVRPLEEALRQLEDSLRRANQEARDGHLTGSVDMAWLAAHRRFILSVQRKGVTLLQRIALAQRLVNERRAALLEAAREVKVLEKLRENHWEEFRMAQQKKEFTDMDEAGMQIAPRLAGEESARAVEEQ